MNCLYKDYIILSVLITIYNPQVQFYEQKFENYEFEIVYNMSIQMYNGRHFIRWSKRSTKITIFFHTNKLKINLTLKFVNVFNNYFSNCGLISIRRICWILIIVQQLFTQNYTVGEYSNNTQRDTVEKRRVLFTLRF